MFLTIHNSSGHKSVNTNRVTNLVIEGDKFIFNLDYSVSLPHDNSKLIPDYVYMVTENDEEYDYLDNAIADLNWIANSYPEYRKSQYSSNDNWHIVNPAMISFIKYDKANKRIIFNLRNTISFKRDYEKKTSGFIYYDFETDEIFNDEMNRIEGILKNC